MKIAHYLPYYPSCDGSGAFCRGLTRAMNRQDPGSGIIITCKKGIEAHQDEVLWYYPKSANHPFYLPEGLVEDLENKKAHLDGIVLHGTYNPPMVRLAKRLKKIGMPYLFIPHDPYPPSLRSHHCWRKAVFWHFFERGLIEGARKVQLLDASHEHFLRELGLKVGTFVLPNGCEVESLEVLTGEEKVPGEGDFIISFLGRMDRNHKGLDLLIEGFSEFIQNGPTDAFLVLSGNDWTDRGELERLVEKLGIGERVRFMGRRPEHSLTIHGEADLAVLTSRFDGFGLTVVEAMLAKRPVLVSKEAGVSSHVEKAGGGWVVAPTVAEIANGLREAYRSREQLKQMGLANQNYVLSHLTWDQVAARALEAYREIFISKS